MQASRTHAGLQADRFPTSSPFLLEIRILKNLSSRVRALAPLVIAGAMSLTVCAPAVASAAKDKAQPVPVANFTQWGDAELAAYVADKLPEELKRTIRERNLTVVAETYRFPSLGACLATVGLSEAAPAGLNPRSPAYTVRYGQSGGHSDAAVCVRERFQGAISRLAETPLASLLDGIDSTKSVGGHREPKPADATLVHLDRNFDTGYDTARLFDAMGPFRFNEAVDYRHVSTHVRSSSLELDNGGLMCVARAGFVARPPLNRSARIPSFRHTYVVVKASGTKAACEEEASLDAVRALMRETWVGKDGAMNDIARTKESDIPLPDLKRVATLEKKLIAEAEARRTQASTRATTVSHNRTTCSNQCSNGDCLRTFPDGRHERWQAPRRIDPFSGNWGWDTTTNACGT